MRAARVDSLTSSSRTTSSTTSSSISHDRSKVDTPKIFQISHDILWLVALLYEVKVEYLEEVGDLLFVKCAVSHSVFLLGKRFVL